MNKFAALLVLLLMNFCLKAQVNLYVDSSKLVTGVGTSWSTAFKTLNEALNTANAASTSTKYVVHIAKGTYYPPGVKGATNRDTTFFIARPGVTLYGGYPRGGGTRNPSANPTILSGEIGNPSSATDNIYHVMVIADIPANGDSIIVDGLSVCNGTADSFTSRYYNSSAVPFYSGGGLYCKKVLSPALFRNCSFYDNTLEYTQGGDGAAIAIEDSAFVIIDSCSITRNTAQFRPGGALSYKTNWCSISPVIKNTVFSNNSAKDGGAIYINVNYGAGKGIRFTNCQFNGNNSNLTSGSGGAVLDRTYSCDGAQFVNCSFLANNAFGGGAIYATRTYATYGGAYISKCSFIQNKAGNAAGAVYNLSVSGYYRIDSSLFDGNRAASGAGALYCEQDSGLISRCTFTDDSAGNGGGIYVYSSSSTISNCRFSLNKANNGAGIFTDHAWKCRIDQDTLTGNFVSSRGGAIFNANPLQSNNLAISNCLFSGNKASVNGGAVSNGGVYPLSIVNCTFAGDTALQGNAIFNSGTSPSITNCIIWCGSNSIGNNGGSNPAITYSTVQGGYPGTGNIALNPLFVTPVSASLAPTLLGDYRLFGCSPAINAGINSNPYSGTFDLSGNPRQFGANMDQGAFEFPQSFPTAISGKASICINEIAQLQNLTPGGTWTSSNPSIATINSLGQVKGISAGRDTITYSVTASCPMSVKTALQVDTLPAIGPIVGLQTVCALDTIYLSNAKAGGVWSSSNITIATINSSTGALVGKSGGVDTISYTITNTRGCTSISDTPITVHPVYVTSVSDTICAGDPYMIGGVILGNLGSGLYKATVQSIKGCDSTITYYLHVDTVNVTLSQSGATLTSNQLGATYQWVECSTGGIIPGATGRSFTANTNGSYRVLIQFRKCQDTSNCATVTGLSVSKNSNPVFDLSVHPNPSNGQINVHLNNWQGTQLRVCDVTGKERQVIAPKTSDFSVDLSSLPAGVYFMEARTGQQKQVQRIVLLH
jgi:predicted outer membrane repeat protein